jgi:carboxyl-terminal processing protease
MRRAGIEGRREIESGSALLRALRPVAAALLLTGCAALPVPSPVPDLPQSGELSDVARQAIARTKTVYLYPDRLDRRMLIGALDALELRFDPVRFDEGAADAPFGVLWVGDERVRVPYDTELDPDRFVSTLGHALYFVSARLGNELREYEEEGGETNLEVIALSGALEALDRYSTVVSGRGSEDFQIRFSGKLSGIGSRIGREDGKLIAVEVFPDSPASRAGLLNGDEIRLIDGNPTAPLTTEEAVDLIRGEAGTIVRLDVRRTPADAKDAINKQLAITRGEVNIPSVEARNLEGGIGYARIRQVSGTTSQEFYAKVRGLGPVRGLVLDLRGNTGGSMREAARLADLFLAEGTIFRVMDRSGELDARGASTAPATSRVAFAFPVSVLIDSSTASAAEIFSGAIAPLDRVRLIGQRSFGKGLIQSVVPLPDNNLLKLTVGEYLLSGDRVIQEKGLDPDIALYPVSRQDLGSLAQRPENALPYLLPATGEDEGPIEMGRLLLIEGEERAIGTFRRDREREIEGELNKLGINWQAGDAVQKAQLLQPLQIEGGALSALRGERNQIRICAANPNAIDVPAAWIALEGLPFLSNKLIPLDRIEAQGRACGEVDVDPEDGLTSSPLPIDVFISSGPHPLQREEVRVVAEDHAPQLVIEVVRVGAEKLEVSISNRGCCGTGAIRIGLPGALRTLENVAPQGTEKVELPLTGKTRFVNVLVAGTGASQRIDIPVPDTRVAVTPPELRLSNRTILGRQEVRVTASSPEGLREGWIALRRQTMQVPQKELYVAWKGDEEGSLSTEIGSGENSITTKIETVSGVSLLDVRTITGN